MAMCRQPLQREALEVPGFFMIQMERRLVPQVRRRLLALTWDFRSPVAAGLPSVHIICSQELPEPPA